MVFFSFRLLGLLSAFLILIVISDVHAEPKDLTDSNPAATSGEINIDLIQAKIAEIKTDSSMDEAAQNRLIELYKSALKQIKAARSYKRKTDYYRKSALDASGEVNQINKQINQIIETSKRNSSTAYKRAKPDQLENQLFESRLRLESLKNNLEKLGRRLKQQQNQPEKIRIEQRSIQDKLEDLENQIQGLPGDQNGAYEARVSSLRATEQALQANLEALQMELNSHLPRLQLLRARYDRAITRVAVESTQMEELEKVVAENRESEAARYSQDLADALQAASNKHPLIKASIQTNFELGKEFRLVSEAIANTTKQRDHIQDEIKRIENESENSEKKVSLAGLSPTLATILREQRRLLPTDSQIDQLLENLNEKTGKVTLRLFEIEELQRNFLDSKNRLEEKLTSGKQKEEINSHQRMRVRVELNLLLEDQKAMLLKLSQAYTKYLNILGELEYAKHRWLDVTHAYAAFLDENLLWVKSSPPVDYQFLWNIVEALTWIISPKLWMTTASCFVISIKSWKPLVFALSVWLLGLIGARRGIKARLKQIAESVGTVRNDRFRYTLDAIGLNILLVVPASFAVYGIGWLLTVNPAYPDFTRAVGKGLCAASVPYFMLQIFYRIFVPGGIAELHLRWRRKTVGVLATQLGWLRFVVVPCTFLIAMTANQRVPEYSDSLGRLALITVMIAMSYALGRTLHPSNGGLKYFLLDHASSLIARTRYIWYSAFVIIPLVIAGFAAAGYLASAVELQQKLVATIRVIFLSIFVHSLTLRGLRLFNRELGLKKLREKRELEKAGKPLGEAGEAIPGIEQAQIDISTINSQTMRLVLTVIIFGAVVGLWLLWEDVLPALAILKEWVLWHKTIVVDGVETVKPVAMSNLLVAMVYILIAVTATRNLPGVMEVLIMNRFSIDSGSRYAINQLIGYALIAATVILVAAELGGQWSELQWLVAALGVGLGFGLQEIFANFISGIILLFERPIRIGDTVTVGEVSGTVSRIQIRATTITDWERKDLVVPNKTFITDRLINWTRTDNITRILISIGIAYGSDVKLAHELMLQIVHEHPMVLREPEPSVFFVGFGESSLDFEIRVYVKEIADRLPLTHDLNMQLNRALAEHGIEIPFPQRDIHLRSAVPLPTSIQDSVPAKEPATQERESGV